MYVDICYGLVMIMMTLLCVPTHYMLTYNHTG